MKSSRAVAIAIMTAFAVTTAQGENALQVAATPTTPTQALPQQKTKIPPGIKYVAHLENMPRATPPRLGGWECAIDHAKCTLATTGPATQAKLYELCRGLWTVAREKRIKLKISEFHAYNPHPEPRLSLDKPGIARCNG